MVFCQNQAKKKVFLRVFGLNACDAVIFRQELERLQCVCPKCDHHMRISARCRLDYLLDVIIGRISHRC